MLNDTQKVLLSGFLTIILVMISTVVMMFLFLVMVNIAHGIAQGLGNC